jgi:hypothetical protein
MVFGPVMISPLYTGVVAAEFVYTAKLWGVPESWLSKLTVTAEQAGTVIVEVLKAIFFAIKPMVTAPPDGAMVVVTGVVVVVGGRVMVMVSMVVDGAVEVGVAVGVGVAGGVGVVQPAARSRPTARRARSTYACFGLMSAPMPFKVY